MMWLIRGFVRQLARLGDRGATGLAYLAIVGSAAFALTITMSIPFGSILAVAVVIAPRRWKSIVLLSSVGSSLGAVVIYLGFHHFGWAQFLEAYPDVAASKAWRDGTRWVSNYGVYAIFAISALPLPQSPALMFAGITRLPVVEVWAAVLLGKLFKYGVYGALVAAFPRKFAKRYTLLLMHARQRPV